MSYNVEWFKNYEVEDCGDGYFRLNMKKSDLTSWTSGKIFSHLCFLQLNMLIC